MSGLRSRRKGQRHEQVIVNLLRDAGLDAARVPLSGMHGGAFSGDILVGEERFEAKIRKGGNGFKQIYDWLGDNAGLFIRADRQELLIVVRAVDWIELKRERDA